jgi:putative FmdB family regulatory protein
MPIYAYQCSACGEERDVLQKVSDPPLTVCPACQQPSLAKKVTAAGFQLKGSGWYVTDFRDKGAKKEARGKSDAAEAPAAEAGQSAAQPATTPANGSAAATSAAPAPAAAAATPAKSTTNGPSPAS